RSAIGHGPNRLPQHRRPADENAVRAHHRRGPARVARPRRDDHQGSAELPDRADRLKVFTNPEALELPSSEYIGALSAVDVDAFPIVKDFAIELRESEDLGQHVYYVSPTRGELAGFPYWDNAERDMRHFTAEDV